MQILPRQTRLTVFGLAALLALGCKGGLATPQPRLVSQFEPLSEAITRNEKYQPDVKVLATAEGESVRVRVQNLFTGPIEVQSSNFGVILMNQPTRQIYPYDPRSHQSSFRKVSLKPGELTEGVIRFSGLGNLAGHRLVFEHSETRPSVAPIQGQGAAQPVVRRPAEPTPLPPIPAQPSPQDDSTLPDALPDLPFPGP